MFAAGILKQGKRKDQRARPDYEQRNHRKRPEISEHSFAPGLRFNVARQLRIWRPGIAVEQNRDPEMPLHPPWQNDRFECIQQDGQDDRDSRYQGENVHGNEMNRAWEW